MPPSAAATGDDDEDHALPSSNPSFAQISGSDMDIDNGDDEEEEDPEEEVGGGDNDDEEEIEEKEEVEEEEVDQRRNDNRQHLESDRQMGSHSTLEMSEMREDSVSNFKCSGPLDGPLTLQKEKSCVNYLDSWSPKLSKHLVIARKNGTLEHAINKTDAFGHSKTHLSNSSEAVAVETTEPFVITGIEVDVVLSKRNCLGQEANVVLDSKEELKPVDVKSEDSKEQTESRLVASVTRARSLSPSTELRDGNKRAAVICDFFAKGWCIRGSSCRFLHKTNKADNTGQQLGLDEVAIREDQFDEGARNILETPKFPHFPDPVAASTGKEATFSSHFSSERLPPLEHKENERLHQLDDEHKLSLRQRVGIPLNAKQFSSSKDDPSFSSSFKDVGMENFRQHWPATDCGSYTSLINRGSSFSFSSSFDTSLLGSQKLLDSDRASRSSSLPRSASAFSGSEPESLSLASVPGDQLRHAEHKTKISSNDWEPSIPFRPSFFITPEMISSARSKYDPLRDSFVLPNVGDKSFKFSFFSLGASISNALQQPIYGDSLSNRNFGTECKGDKSTISSHDKPHRSLSDKNCSTPGKDSFTTATVTGGAGTADGENGSALKEESASGIGYEKVNRVTNKNDCDARPQIDRSRHKKDLKADSVRQNNDMEVDQKIGGDLQKESKVLRHFRAALIDFVKDLLKPTWREGHLSKDAHNTIVKKTVEKVLSTLQPHQIPANVESIKQYLSSSQPKMAKLVEGYISKYGKS
ncbi:PREDICTED: protein FRIGIDA-ESSENTIAL 1 isoform X2 [Populus euphratica]|uniref:Protein FRIGIDA-ESSENTIAL 1 isoform X2 n=1 Tax=Populus euphratica TaxID=75702 RepID=A0AAJ6Y619_POPEU|nr:PREDICTED: protein FRIGIDA-ESSENTIAL 1 isoform X2 [Populus euphratica]